MIPQKIAYAFLLVTFLFFSAVPQNLYAAEIAYNETGSAVPVKTFSAQNPEDSQAVSEDAVIDAAVKSTSEFLAGNPLSVLESPEVSESSDTENLSREGGDALLDKTNAPEVSIGDYLSLLSEDGVNASSNDTYYGAYPMWGYDRVKAEQAHTLNRGAGITIAVIDTGLDYNHEDILGNVFTNLGEIAGDGIDNDGDGFIDDVRGWDFVNNDNNAFDDNGHGSHVSGIAAAVSDNAKGIAGIAPDAKILPVKVLDASGSGTIANVIAGIKYAANLGAKIINMSLGIAKKYLSTPLLNAFQDAVNYALGKGAITVVAAGNESVDSNTTAPAGLNNTIAVGATDDQNRKASFSNKNPDLTAPGVNIGSLKAGGGYVYMSGTSMASPYVAGAAALVYSKYSALYAGWTGTQIYSDIYTRLTRSSLDLNKKGYDASFGYGLLDAYAALTYSTTAGTASVTIASEESSANGGGLGLRSFTPSADIRPVFFTHSAGNWYGIEALRNYSVKKKNITKKKLIFESRLAV